MLINNHKGVDLKQYNDTKAFIKYSNVVDDIYENIEEYNRNKDRKILIVFDDMIADKITSINNNKIIH